MGLTDAERKLTTGLRDLAARLARGETIEATRVVRCTRCCGRGYRVAVNCPNCGGTGHVRERVTLSERQAD